MNWAQQERINEREMRRLDKMYSKMEISIPKELTKAVKKGIKPIYNEAKANAPKGKTGNLKDAMITKREKSKKRGKVVYQVTFDSAYNDVLQKVSKDGKISYYPASQEYGWVLKSGKKVPGKYYMRNAADKLAGEFGEVVIKSMMARIETEWKHG
jgi:hypothetical protein